MPINPLMDTVNGSASQSVRASILQRTFMEMRKANPSLRYLDPILAAKKDFSWDFNFGGRKVEVNLPLRGEDGPYLLKIGGSPSQVIKAGIDKYSRMYGFHRISANDEQLAFTIEWKGGGQNESDAMSAIFFLQSLNRLLPIIKS